MGEAGRLRPSPGASSQAPSRPGTESASPQWPGLRPWETIKGMLAEGEWMPGIANTILLAAPAVGEPQVCAHLIFQTHWGQESSWGHQFFSAHCVLREGKAGDVQVAVDGLTLLGFAIQLGLSQTLLSPAQVPRAFFSLCVLHPLVSAAPLP